MLGDPDLHFNFYPCTLTCLLTHWPLTYPLTHWPLPCRLTFDLRIARWPTDLCFAVLVHGVGLGQFVFHPLHLTLRAAWRSESDYKHTDRAEWTTNTHTGQSGLQTHRQGRVDYKHTDRAEINTQTGQSQIHSQPPPPDSRPVFKSVYIDYIIIYAHWLFKMNTSIWRKGEIIRFKGMLHIVK
jgi:hypothetical protein